MKNSFRRIEQLTNDTTRHQNPLKDSYFQQKIQDDRLGKRVFLSVAPIKTVVKPIETDEAATAFRRLPLDEQSPCLHCGKDTRSEQIAQQVESLRQELIKLDTAITHRQLGIQGRVVKGSGETTYSTTILGYKLSDLN